MFNETLRSLPLLYIQICLPFYLLEEWEKIQKSSRPMLESPWRQKAMKYQRVWARVPSDKSS